MTDAFYDSTRAELPAPCAFCDGEGSWLIDEGSEICICCGGTGYHGPDETPPCEGAPMEMEDR